MCGTGYHFVGFQTICYFLGVARFIDASIYRDTFPTIRIAVLFVIIPIFFFLSYNDFHLGRKDT